MQRNLSMITVVSWSSCFQFYFPQPIPYLATRAKFQKCKSDMLLLSFKFPIDKIMSKLSNMINSAPASLCGLHACHHSPHSPDSSQADHLQSPYTTFSSCLHLLLYVVFCARHIPSVTICGYLLPTPLADLSLQVTSIIGLPRPAPPPLVQMPFFCICPSFTIAPQLPSCNCLFSHSTVRNLKEKLCLIQNYSSNI